VQGENRGLSFDETVAPLPIGHDVWIDQNVLLKGGISIGDGAIIAAGSVVTKNVAPYSIVGGNPATVIKSRFSDEIICDLTGLQWWTYRYDSIQLLDFSDPKTFIKDFPTTGQLKVLPEQRLNAIEHIKLYRKDNARNTEHG